MELKRHIRTGEEEGRVRRGLRLTHILPASIELHISERRRLDSQREAAALSHSLSSFSLERLQLAEVVVNPDFDEPQAA